MVLLIYSINTKSSPRGTYFGGLTNKGLPPLEASSGMSARLGRLFLFLVSRSGAPPFFPRWEHHDVIRPFPCHFLAGVSFFRDWGASTTTKKMFLVLHSFERDGSADRASDFAFVLSYLAVYWFNVSPFSPPTLP